MTSVKNSPDGEFAYVPEGILARLARDSVRPAAMRVAVSLRRTLMGFSSPGNVKTLLMESLHTSQKGFEPLTDGLEGRCSIQLSYWDIISMYKKDALFIITHPFLFSKYIFIAALLLDCHLTAFPLISRKYSRMRAVAP